MKKQINIAKKGLLLADEVIKLTNKGKRDNVSAEEYPEIKDCFERNSYSRQFIETLSEKKLIKGNDKQRQVEKLISQLNFKKKQSEVRKRLIRYGSSIAAAAMAISFVAWYANEGKSPIQETTQVNIQKPLLILENGKKVDLTQGDEVFNSDNIAVNSVELRLTYTDKDDSSRNAVKYNTIVVPSRYTYNVVLSDGSQVKLNANSELRYPVQFRGEKREVFLKGEGYFTVAKSDLPFIVSTSEIDVRVYGTIFNINLHKKGIVETLLLEGSVGVKTKNLQVNREVVITPSQEFSLCLGNEEISVNQVDIEQHLDWINNYFKCDSTPLEDLICDISSWYGVDFEFADTGYKKNRVTVTLSRELELKDLLSILESTLEIKFVKQKNNQYEINKKE